MRFTIIRSESLVVVDNAVSNISVASLPANVEVVVYQETDGKIEYNDRPSVRTVFTDPSPYQALINAFITDQAALVPALQLAQAKQIKKDLVEGIFHHKRRLPYIYNTWQYEATDEAVANMSMLLQGSSGVAGLVASINNALTYLKDQINTYVVTQNNSSAGSVNQWSSFHNTNWSLMYRGPGGAAYTLGDPIGGASPGGAGAGPGSGGFLTMSTVAVPTVSGSSGPSGNITYQPLNATTPQTIPAADVFSGLLGIANRRNSLNSNRLTKQVAVNNLTTIAAVTAYDATAGWSS